MTVSPFDHPILSGLLGDEEVAEHFSTEAEIAAFVRFESALAEAEATEGVISAEAGQAIAAYIASIGDELSEAKVLEDLDPAAFDLVFVPGGHGPMEDLAVSERFGAMVRAFAESGRPVAAVCHGPAALLSARADDGSWLFSGYQLTAFSNVEEDQVGYAKSAVWLLEDRLKDEGGLYTAAAEPWGERVVVDRNLYTGQNPASSEALALRLVADLA